MMKAIGTLPGVTARRLVPRRGVAGGDDRDLAGRLDVQGGILALVMVADQPEIEPRVAFPVQVDVNGWRVTLCCSRLSGSTRCRSSPAVARTGTTSAAM